MCGISGIWNLSGANVNGQETIRSMNNSLRHRGPDDEGTWSDVEDKLFLGHRRLSIIDTSAAGHQPMISDKGTVVVFNGEIYNYKALKSRFFPGFSFRSGSDTEVLLLLYEKFGHDCLQYLNGMFAFALWDPERQELFMARDRAGEKPFYYTFHKGAFAFASELRALLKLPGFNRSIDQDALYHFLTFNLLASPQTMFSGIEKLPPAHFMVIGKNGVPDIKRYWTPHYQELEQTNEDTLAIQLENKLNASVQLRMVSDVPVGAFLSGGVDSSAMVSMMSEKVATPLHTYSIGFEGQSDYDERTYAASIANRFSTIHHEYIVKREEISSMLPQIIDSFDEPLADATCIPIWFLAQEARQNGTPVIITGDGSDELFAGYRNWQKYIKLNSWYDSYKSLPGFIKKSLASGLKLFSGNEIMLEMMERAARNQVFFWGGAKSFKESVKRQVLRNKNIAGDSYQVIDFFRQQFENDFTLRRKHPVDWMCYLGYHFNIPNYYLHRMDRLGMAHAVEIRTPFLDHEFVAFALSVSPEMKIKNGEPKYILKKALEKRLSREVLYRKKRGFNVPLREWAGELMLDDISQNLRNFCDEFTMFDYDGLNAQLIRLRQGDSSVANRLWTIYFLMHWCKRWTGSDDLANSR